LRIDVRAEVLFVVVAALQGQTRAPTVAADGSGDFPAVQAAVMRRRPKAR
jgi:hypothetical protein